MKKIWDRKFFAFVLAIAVPIMVQNAITNFVALLDNIMIGQLGTEPMSGVAIVNQLIFVFNITVFGAVGGAGIFTSQFHGSSNPEGIRQTFRYKMLLALLIVLAGFVILGGFPEPLINAWLHQSESVGDLAATMQSAKDYLRIMLWGLLFFAVKDVYASTLRETKEGDVKLSVRAVPGYDATVLTAKFGGGGHKGAAGATLKMPLAEAAKAVEKAMLEL